MLTDFAVVLMYEEITKFIDSTQDGAIEALKKLVRIPTVAAKGEGLPETADLVEKMLHDVGLETKQYPITGGA
ncbi:MAG: hypothetical protein ACTSPB_24330, partial [Candidatus Thorarchaeota archaeon]